MEYNIYTRYSLLIQILASSIVRKHLTGGFLCAVLDLSGILCSLSIPEYSGINKEQRIPDRSKTAHRKPPVKCFLTQKYIKVYQFVTNFENVLFMYTMLWLIFSLMYNITRQCYQCLIFCLIII